MSLIASWALKLAGRPAARRFDRATRSPRQAQESKLRRILEANAGTEYGRRHGFARIRSWQEYVRAVPVHAYEDIEADLRRVHEDGARNVLTAEDPVMFARTSGTSGDPKYVIVTPTCQGRDQRDQMRTWMHHARKDHPRLFSGKVVSLVSPAIEGYTGSGVPYGSTSGLIYKTMPRVVQDTYAVPYEVFEVPDYDAKYYLVLRFGLAARVTFLCTANPSTILKLCELADRWSEDLVRDVRDGSLRADLDLDIITRRRLREGLRPRPDRARELERARDQGQGVLRPGDYWPDLQLVGCWKGGTVGGHLQRFPRWFARPDGRMAPVRDWGYLSSEARGSIPLGDEGAGGVLTVGTNVYDFVPVEEVESGVPRERWTVLAADEVSVGRQYYILLTTTGGLYRYDINDVVEVTDLHHRTPVITFRRKGRGVVSLTGEKVTADQVVLAFEAARAALGEGVPHFRVEADAGSSRYVFRVEGVGAWPERRLQALLRTLDGELRRLNVEYDAKRGSRRLLEPVLLLMRPGWYEAIKRDQARAGRRVFQAKTEVLALGGEARSPFEERTIAWEEA